MNPILDGIAPSLIRELHGRKRPTSIDLGLGEPTLRPDMAPLRAAMAWIEENGCPYSPNAGFSELREAVARHHGYPGLDTAASACITVGSQEALHVAMKTLLDPQRDEVLIIAPAYPLYVKLCQLEGIAWRMAWLDPDDGFRPDAARVLEAVTERTRAVVLASPSNPTGRVWPEAELAKLGAGLRSLPRPPYLIADEVYVELYFGDRPAAAARHYERTIVAGSLSKSCALTGLRLGWLLAPPDLMPAIVKVHHFAVSCAGTIAQRAALEVFRQPALLGAGRPFYERQREALLQALRASELPHIVPEGAFYCFLRLRGAWAKDSVKTSFSLLDRKDVVAVPGAVFGDRGEGWLRVTFVAPPEKIEEGVRRIRELLDEEM
jgi:aspartate/methionine/tyrosine aminotransferase